MAMYLVEAISDRHDDGYVAGDRVIIEASKATEAAKEVMPNGGRVAVWTLRSVEPTIYEVTTELLVKVEKQ